MTGHQVDRRRRIFVGMATTAAVLMVAHHPIDFTSAQADPVRPVVVTGGTGTPPTQPIAATGNVATDPGCQEDEAAVVAYDPDPSHGLTWICVAIDDFADEATQARLEELSR